MPNKKKPLELDMCAATEIRDVQGEILKLEGADISELLAGRGRLNDNHGSGNFNMLGRVTFAKKIFQAEDCDDERQKHYWEQVKSPYLYVKGVLFDDEDHPNAKACAAILRHIHKADAPLKLKASVEGGVIQRGLKDSTILQSTKIHSVALTFTPANRTTLVEPTNLNKSVSEAQEKIDYELINSVVHLAKQDREIPSFRHITRDASASKILDNLKKIEELANNAGIELNISAVSKENIIDGAVKQKIFKNINEIKELTAELNKAIKVKRGVKITNPPTAQAVQPSGIVTETPGRPQAVEGTPSPKVQAQRDKYAKDVGVMTHRGMVGANAPVILDEPKVPAVTSTEPTVPVAPVPPKTPDDVVHEFSQPKIMRVISTEAKFKKDKMLSSIRKDLLTRLPEHKVNSMMTRLSSLPLEQIRHVAKEAYKNIGTMPSVLNAKNQKKKNGNGNGNNGGDLEKGAIWDNAKAGIVTLAMLHGAHELGKPSDEAQPEKNQMTQHLQQFADSLNKDPKSRALVGDAYKVTNLEDIPMSHKLVTQEVGQDEPLLGAIAQKESSGGQTYKHKTINDPGGMHHGHTAAGAWAIMPHNAAYALRNDATLRMLYPELHAASKNIDANHKQITEALNNDPHTSADFARSLVKLAREKLGNDDSAVAYSWLNGITGAMKAQKKGKGFIANHPYTKAIMKDYNARVGGSKKTRSIASDKVTKALTAGYGGGHPMNATGGQVIQSESLDEFDPGKGFKYITCHPCGKEQVHSKNQTRCRHCGKSFSMEQLFKLLKGQV